MQNVESVSGRTFPEQDDLYRLLVETSQDLIWAVNAKGCWTFVNRAATRRIYGREPAELIGRPFTEMQTPEQAVKDQAVFGRILSGDSFFDYETVHLHKNGSPIHLNFNAVVLRGTKGDVIGTVGTAKDITETKRLQAEAKDLNAKLQQTQKIDSLSLLAGGVAHDFNNLLVGILANSSLALFELPHGSLARKSIQAVVSAAERAGALARQMLACSGRGTFVVERLDLAFLVKDLRDLASAVASKNAVISFNVDADVMLVEADASQIRQVIINLIMNASDALRGRAGLITVTAGCMQADREYLRNTYVDDHIKAGPYFFVDISDTGCGMTSATATRIFEPFYSTKGPSHGLGLAAVLGILRSHGGAIHVESEVGRGSTFRILLPAIPGSVNALPPVNEASRECDDFGHDAGTVLVVDDEEIVRATTRGVLEHAGFQVLIANDGDSALEIFREQHERIGAVLLDLSMPNLSGEATLRELQRIDPKVRVVLTSGYSEPETAERFAILGVANFLRKPSTATEMSACVRRVLRR